MTRAILAIACGVFGLWVASPASAQTADAGASRGYAQIVAQSAFGNITTQSYGAEGGIPIRPGLFVFVEAGRVRDVSPEAFAARAQAIADGVAALAGGATVSFKEPVTFAVAGPKRVASLARGAVRPYVMAGLGIARVTRNVDIRPAAGSVDQFVTLGNDLSGTATNAFMTAGGGVGLWVAGPLVLDLHYRFGRVLASGEGVTIQRAGIGIGVEF